MTLPGLLELRTAIDAVDQKILDLLKERLTLVMRVGAIKREHGAPIHDPEREQQLLERLVTRADSPLDVELVRRVFLTIVEESRRCEHRTEPK